MSDNENPSQCPVCEGPMDHWQHVASNVWQPIETAPKDGTEIILYYSNWLDDGELVVSGHWLEQEGREFEATWEHGFGYGNAQMWVPMPEMPE